MNNYVRNVLLNRYLHGKSVPNLSKSCDGKRFKQLLHVVTEVEESNKVKSLMPLQRCVSLQYNCFLHIWYEKKDIINKIGFK